MRERLGQLWECLGTRDLVEIAILAAVLYVALRFLRHSRGSGVVRGFGLVIIGLFLVAQVIIATFNLTVLGKVLDYLHTTVLLGLLVIFQPELRRGLAVLGRYQLLMRYLGRDVHEPMVDKLADACEDMSQERVGGLMAIEREVSLAPFVETGERLDSEVSAALLRTIFSHNTPLHDGAVIIRHGRVAAAACQLPLGHPPDRSRIHLGMRHRAALALSEETDAVVLVVSEETGRISLAVGGRLEPVSREILSRRLADQLRADPPARAAA